MLPEIHPGNGIPFKVLLEIPSGEFPSEVIVRIIPGVPS